MVGLGRFELPTSPLSGVRSNQLSYRPVIVVELLEYINPEELNHMASVNSAIPTIANPNVTGRAEVERVSRTRLNMQSSYAALDRRGYSKEAEMA